LIYLCLRFFFFFFSLFSFLSLQVMHVVPPYYLSSAALSWLDLPVRAQCNPDVALSAFMSIPKEQIATVLTSGDYHIHLSNRSPPCRKAYSAIWLLPECCEHLQEVFQCRHSLLGLLTLYVDLPTSPFISPELFAQLGVKHVVPWLLERLGEFLELNAWSEMVAALKELLACLLERKLDQALLDITNATMAFRSAGITLRFLRLVPDLASQLFSNMLAGLPELVRQSSEPNLDHTLGSFLRHQSLPTGPWMLELLIVYLLKLDANGLGNEPYCRVVELLLKKLSWSEVSESLRDVILQGSLAGAARCLKTLLRLKVFSQRPPEPVWRFIVGELVSRLLSQDSGELTTVNVSEFVGLLILVAHSQAGEELLWPLHAAYASQAERFDVGKLLTFSSESDQIIDLMPASAMVRSLVGLSLAKNFAHMRHVRRLFASGPPVMPVPESFQHCKCRHCTRCFQLLWSSAERFSVKAPQSVRNHVKVQLEALHSGFQTAVDSSTVPHTLQVTKPTGERMLDALELMRKRWDADSSELLVVSIKLANYRCVLTANLLRRF
jgi:hypothetical protein